MRYLLSLALFFFSFGVYAQSSYKIESFSPQGVVKSPSQVSVRFSEDMVKLGDPREEGSVFDSNCLELGSRRWLDTKNWVFDFYKTPEAGLECEFRLNSDFRSLSGNKPSGRKDFRFSTGGIKISSTSPWRGSEIGEDQYFLVRVDGEVDEKSVERHAYFLTDSSSQKINVNIVKGKLREELIQAAYWYSIPGDRILVLSPKTNFPSESKVRLVWQKEIRSQTNVTSQKDQILNFKVRSKFLASIYCERENSRKDCIPILDIKLSFSSSMDKKYLRGIYLQDKNGKKWKGVLSDYEENSNSFSHVTFRGPFPEKSTLKIHVPDSIQDDSGRKLGNISRFPLSVKTDSYPPLAKFSSKFGILEKKASPILPVTIRNLDSVVTGKILKINPEDLTSRDLAKWLSGVYRHNRKFPIFTSEDKGLLPLQVPKTLNDGSTEVVGIPLIKSGLYVVELESGILGESLLGKKKKLYVPTVALVTDLSIHFKWGRESSLVWVTELSSGKPAENAIVKIADCKGKIYVRGKTDSQGVFSTGQLPERNKIPNCSYESYNSGLYVIAQKDSDVSFLHSSWNRGIETWRYNLPYASFRDEQIVHTVLDRSLFRAGETVSMKHLVRKHSMRGFVAPDMKTIPSYIMIKHEGTEERWYHKIKWAYPGKSDSKWKIPLSAKLGTYSVYLSRDDQNKWGLEKLVEFRVEEFRLPILKASVSSSQTTWVDSPKIPLTLQASYMAGGAASRLPVKLRTRILPAKFEPKGWEKFTFSSAPLKTGRVSNQDPERKKQGYTTVSAELDKNGIYSHSIPWKEREEVSTLFAEMEFKDPNGEIQSVSNRIRLLPANQFVGIASDSYFLTQDNIELRTAVVDRNGKAGKNIAVEVHAFSKETFTHRKRLVGGFYSYEYFTEIKDLGKICSGKTNENGFFVCKSKDFSHTGEVYFEARSRDNKGNLSYANKSMWIAGKNDWYYSASDNDRMDISLDKNNYKVGESAKIKINSPFPKFTALVTVEREGILRTYVREVDGKSPVVSIPVEKFFSPNAFVSVLAVRGRVGNPKPTSMIDLARPSFRLGLTEMKVGWDPYRLKVSVKTDKPEYQVRTKANVKIKVTDSNKRPIGLGGEVALAVVDEALLELSANKSWDLLSAMMGVRGLEVESYSAQMQVVGKRHFGRKAIPAGGGGGNQPTRELLDTLLYWNPSLKLDKKGEATVSVPLNDSLTSYRVVAIATAGIDGFGTAENHFTATQDVLVFSGLPPVVRTGDLYFQEYNTKNNTKASKRLRFSLSAKGSNGKESFQNQVHSLEPGESKRIGWDVKIGEKEGDRVSLLDVYDGNKKIDSLKITQKIEPSIPARTTQGTLFQLDGKKDIPISLPKDGLVGKGSVGVVMSSTILGSTDGIKKYMAQYPYTCMEQKVSKAVVSEDKTERKQVAGELGSHLDQDGLVKYFPTSQWGDEILTAYILSITHEADWKLPKQNLDSMVSGLNRFLDGTLVRRRPYSFSDSVMRRLQVMEALSRYGKLDEKRLDSMVLDIPRLPTSSLLDLISILERSGKSGGKQGKLLTEIETNLRGRLNIQGREMKLSDDFGDLWWMMGSGDQDSARFLSFALNRKIYREDLGRLAKGFVGRMKDGRFSTTLSNSYGYLALKKFAKTQEKDKVRGNSRISLLQMKRDISWKGKPVESFSAELPMNQKSSGDLSVEHNGSGKPWVSIATVSAVPLKENWDNGIRIRKTTKPLERKKSGRWSVGDIIQVKLEFEIDAPRTWVVVNDPVPTGATILGSGLGRDRNSLGEGNISNDYYASFQERSFSGYRSYYEYLPKGKYSLEYSFRINQTGRFSLPPTRSEAMYSPDIFGETPNEDWVILP